MCDVRYIELSKELRRHTLLQALSDCYLRNPPKHRYRCYKASLHEVERGMSRFDLHIRGLPIFSESDAIWFIKTVCNYAYDTRVWVELIHLVWHKRRRSKMQQESVAI